jgi:hypothetical protein
VKEEGDKVRLELSTPSANERRKKHVIWSGSTMENN